MNKLTVVHAGLLRLLVMLIGGVAIAVEVPGDCYRYWFAAWICVFLIQMITE